MKLPLTIIATVSALFFLVSYRSFGTNPETSELFRLFMGISNTIALFVPLTIFMFCLLTSGLMFNLLDEKYQPKKMARIIALSFIPIILNCLAYLTILYNIPIGLTISEMPDVSYLAWVGFFAILAILTKTEFQLSFFKAVVISLFPTIIVIGLQAIF